ncbi:unnamed protein product [Allacma fusca]|uniref:Thioredoxin domain-containing protein n=1 Tax=Allacma fusca TaxID=39272 RepID=A0A8J2L595_9HEXA|nr:unnamed protein product [Allacma fusca]
MSSQKSAYDFTYIDVDGNEQSISKYRGRVLLVVNVASACGLTDSNYKQLQHLYDKYQDQGLSILGFPCNQFLYQEGGTENEIKEFACSRYKVTFDLAKKIEVNGGNTHPFWAFLKEQQGGLLGNFIKWNFTKFVVDKNGQVVKRFGPSTTPSSFEDELVQLLKN